ncbi:unnamed protein product [Citrullus colocynthis]|uniref:Uncharacterized protein n=1 Tax=Citrullus colocynthis TaxID=252529 RepID=A0ABP0Z809_9ROSI
MKLLQSGKPMHLIAFRRELWVLEGRPVCREELRNMIKELRVYNRFKHALEHGFSYELVKLPAFHLLEPMKQ